jgi:phosphorylcholine metabolism protein LicD
MEWNNYKREDAGCDKYGNDRLKLAVYLRDKVFTHLSQPIFIENGTLLGAWRNQKFIAHDDDFDFGILIDSKNDISNILKKIKDNLPTYYHCRLVDDYSEKIEIYDPAFGNYKLLGPKYNNANYHYITVDLQFYLRQDNGQYKCLYYIDLNKKWIDKSLIEPCGNIVLEGEDFKSPKNTKEFLRINYGYLGEDAEYSNETGLYYKKL